jgi:hypothetical protein
MITLLYYLPPCPLLSSCAVSRQATSATLFYPYFLFGDTDGNLFIADSSNRRIRLVSTSTGIITTLAGTGELENSGDGGQVNFIVSIPSHLFVIFFYVNIIEFECLSSLLYFFFILNKFFFFLFQIRFSYLCLVSLSGLLCFFSRSKGRVGLIRRKQCLHIGF